MRPEQHPASNSNARKAHAEATDPHGGCKVGTCKAEDQWRRVSCAGGGGEVEASAFYRAVKEVFDLQCPPRQDVEYVPGAHMAHQWWTTVLGSVLDRYAALAAQPAAPQPTEGGAMHFTDEEHWSGWCDATTGEGTTDRAAVTCRDCLVAATSAEYVTIDEPSRPDPRTLLAVYMLRDGYEGAEVQEYLDAHFAPQPTEGVTLTEAERLSVWRALYDTETTSGWYGQPECEEVARLVTPAVERIKADAYAAGLAARSQRPEDCCEFIDLCPQSSDVSCREQARRRGTQHPEGVTVTDWKVDHRNNGCWPFEDVYANESTTRFAANGRPILSRQRTTFPDAVTEWAEVSGDTEAATEVMGKRCGTCMGSGWFGSRHTAAGSPHLHCPCGAPCVVDRAEGCTGADPAGDKKAGEDHG